MERLTLDEAIKYIKEVVQKNRKNKEKNTIVIPNSFISSADCAEKYEQVAEWLEELKSYKEAEEHGLLVKLPDDLHRTLYQINYEYTECTEYGEEKISAKSIIVNMTVIVEKNTIYLKLICNIS